ncbi:MAG TPA: TRAP transporter TatT component family protein, partial [Elusimicrobiales bacterium]|nr:TRAP transporter TatT component family protein [Elusimicrobiales bacterium]
TLLPGLFWNSFCRAGYIQLDLQNPDSIAELPKLEETTDELLKLAPAFYYNGPHALKAALSAARPVLMGGKPELAKKHFEAALDGKGADFQLNRFLYAKTYAVQAQDPDLFSKLLEQAVTDAQTLPEQRLANEAVKARAKHLLEKKNELF